MSKYWAIRPKPARVLLPIGTESHPHHCQRMGPVIEDLESNRVSIVPMRPGCSAFLGIAGPEGSANVVPGMPPGGDRQKRCWPMRQLHQMVVGTRTVKPSIVVENRGGASESNE